ncbi:MAG: hypothetical protein JWN08_185 [Frankiales bacterium]|jgi:hypothetical protein|nr:hypothetical protein [Frankiales bacterium]
MRMKRSSLAITAALGLAVAGGSAFTAGNTGTPVASAGFQATDTAGFAVSDVQYELGANANLAGDTGDDVVKVNFTLTPATGALGATRARVRLVKADLYYTCTTASTTGVTDGVTTWTCTTTGLESSAIDTLEIVAVSQPTVS